MFLAVDIGNTNIVVGCFEGDKLLTEFRLRTELTKTRDEYGAILMELLERRVGDRVCCEAAVISSVVPPLTIPMRDILTMEFGVVPLIVSNELKTGINIKIPEPATLGADRIVNSVAVKYEYGLPALVVDFGTATTIDYVDKDANYLGGTISPGLEISLDALVSKTAKLPRIERVFPERLVCNETVPAMQAGTLIGYECLISGLIERIENETKESFPYIVTTGGAGQMLSERININAEKKGLKPRLVYDASLTLKGILQIWKLNS